MSDRSLLIEIEIKKTFEQSKLDKEAADLAAFNVWLQDPNKKKRLEAVALLARTQSVPLQHQKAYYRKLADIAASDVNPSVRKVAVLALTKLIQNNDLLELWQEKNIDADTALLQKRCWNTLFNLGKVQTDKLIHKSMRMEIGLALIKIVKNMPAESWKHHIGAEAGALFHKSENQQMRIAVIEMIKEMFIAPIPNQMRWEQLIFFLQGHDKSAQLQSAASSTVAAPEAAADQKKTSIMPSSPSMSSYSDSRLRPSPSILEDEQVTAPYLDEKVVEMAVHDRNNMRHQELAARIEPNYNSDRGLREYGTSYFARRFPPITTSGRHSVFLAPQSIPAKDSMIADPPAREEGAFIRPWFPSE